MLVKVKLFASGLAVFILPITFGYSVVFADDFAIKPDPLHRAAIRVVYPIIHRGNTASHGKKHSVTFSVSLAGRADHAIDPGGSYFLIVAGKQASYQLTYTAPLGSNCVAEKTAHRSITLDIKLDKVSPVALDPMSFVPDKYVTNVKPPIFNCSGS